MTPVSMQGHKKVLLLLALQLRVEGLKIVANETQNEVCIC